MTKLATASVIQVLVNAMDGCLPTRIIAHRTSATPGPANRGDIAGDGPSSKVTNMSEDNASTHDIYFGSMFTRLKKLLLSVEPWNPPIASLGSAMRSPSTSLVAQTASQRSLPQTLVWILAAVALSALRQWLRSRAGSKFDAHRSGRRKVKGQGKGGKDRYADLSRKFSSAHLTTEWATTSSFRSNTGSSAGDVPPLRSASPKSPSTS